MQFPQSRWFSCPSQACDTESLSKILTRQTDLVIIVCYFRQSSRSLSHLYMSAIVAFFSVFSTSTQHPAFSWGDATTLGKGPTGLGWFPPARLESSVNEIRKNQDHYIYLKNTRLLRGNRDGSPLGIPPAVLCATLLQSQTAAFAQTCQHPHKQSLCCCCPPSCCLCCRWWCRPWRWCCCCCCWCVLLCRRWMRCRGGWICDLLASCLLPSPP